MQTEDRVRKLKKTLQNGHSYREKWNLEKWCVIVWRTFKWAEGTKTWYNWGVGRNMLNGKDRHENIIWIIKLHELHECITKQLSKILNR